MLKKQNFLLVVFVLTSLVLMTYQSRRGAFSVPGIFPDVLNSTNEGLYVIISPFRETLRKIALRDEENRALKASLNQLLFERQKYREAVLENARLRGILSLREDEVKYVATAKVIARGNDRWGNTITANKGRTSGIEKNMTVVTPLGLAGKVLAVSDSYCTILLVNDVNFSAAVRLQENRTEGIISGTGSKVCVLKYVAQEAVVQQGEVVITSGLDSLFPPDIPVGFVSAVTKKGTGLFQYVELTTFQDMTKTEEVVIVRR